MKRIVLILSLLLSVPVAMGAERVAWRDTFTSRVEVLALLQSLNSELLASASATRTLEQWCGEHHMASDAKIVATLVPGVRKEPSPEQLQRLDVHDSAEVRYRHVQLRCGAHELSDADNWYVPARLTAEMNTILETSDTPFGRVVQPLHAYRRTIDVTQLWSPLPRGWENRRQSRFCWCRPRVLAIPREVFRHRAVLYTSGHVPFSEVVETYQAEVLAFGRE